MRGTPTPWLLVATLAALLPNVASAEPLVTHLNPPHGKPAPFEPVGRSHPPSTVTDDLHDFLAPPSRGEFWARPLADLPADPSRTDLLPGVIASTDSNSESGTTVATFKPGPAYEGPTAAGLAQEPPAPAPERISLAPPTLKDLRTPEPASILLLLTGFIGITARRHLLRQRG